jgi:ribonucleoside-diphosphate reductase alpha chain
MMVNKDFVPNSPALMNAGTDTSMMSACISLGIDDDMRDILKTFTNAMISMKYGAGIGIDFSNLRPKDDYIHSTGGTSSGVVSFMEMFNQGVETCKSGGCVAHDTLIQTSKGIKKIGSLIDCPPFADTEINEMVLSKDGFDTAYLSQDNGESDVIELKTEFGYSVKATDNHMIRVVNQDGKFDWKCISDIKIDDWVVIKKGENIVNEYVKLDKIPKSEYHFNVKTDINLPDYLDEEFAELLGFYIADGCISKKVFAMCINDDDVEIIERFKEMCVKYNLHYTASKKENDNSTNYHIASKYFTDFIRHNKIKKSSSLKACIPKKIFESPKTVVYSYIRGMFNCDGTNAHKSYPSYSSASEQLIDELQYLLLSIGIISRKSRVKLTKCKYGNNPIYTLIITDKNSIEVFNENIGFFVERKKVIYEPYNISTKIPFVGNLIKEYYCEEQKKNYPKINKEIRRYIRGDRNPSLYRVLDLIERSELVDKSILKEDLLNNDYYFTKVVELNRTKCYTVDIETMSHEYSANGILVHNKRRGAALASLSVSHPDIEDFITSKLEEGKLSNMNISVRITDNFMQAVEEDNDWELVFDGKVYRTIKARDLFKKIVYGAHRFGEPGVLFVDEITRKEPYKGTEFKIGQNACSESNLLTCNGGGESCILGSINLSNFYDKQISNVANITRHATHFLNNVTDKNFYPVEEVEYMTKEFRRIGIGVMGWHDLLIKSNIPYDSPEAVKTAEEYMELINNTSIHESQVMADKLSRVFPRFDECDIDIKRYNCATTIIAPTGTISLLAGCSSGIEPIFSLVHKRYTWADGEKVGYLQVHPIFEEKLDEYLESRYSAYDWDRMKKSVLEHAYAKGTIQDIAWLPKDFRELFKTSLDISPKAHIDMQAAFQKYTGNNISKTINLPNNTTEEEVWDIYFYGWKKHLKGMTVYRSGSRDIEVLELKKDSTPTTTLPDGRILPKRPSDLPATNSKRRSGCGKLIISVAEKDGNPYECIISNKGGCTAMNDALGQMISLSMRWNVPTWDIIKTLRNVTCPVAYKKFSEGNCDGKSCSDVIGRVIESLIPDKESEPISIPCKVKVTTEDNICPECGEHLSMVEGCKTCACGYSRCG